MTGLTLALAFSAQADAASYNFDIAYSGNGNAVLVGGSDDPNGTNILPGDSFTWTITATGDLYWHVDTGGNFFPLMAFAVDPSGDRFGDFELTLRLDGGDVFAASETGARNSSVHMGTNSIELDTGLEFDQMHLVYTLQSAFDSELQVDVDSIIFGLLPIFGAPEANSFYPGISLVGAPVPVPAALGLLAPCLLGLGVMRRRGG
ncbi:MAG: VPLPA-CTERM sorting domain-containing protein [Gammaproteobacteria bacterium]